MIKTTTKNNIIVQRICQLLQVLSENNLFYRNYLETPINEDNFDNIYKSLPVINKSIIKKNKNTYFSNMEGIDLITEFTSGSTGEPFICYKTRMERNTYSLRLWKERKRIDAKVSPHNFLELFDTSTKRFNINFVDLSDENLHKIFSLLSKIKPRWLCLSPTMALYYAKFHAIHQYNLDSIKYLELQGEYIDDTVRDMIEQAFQAQTILHYGLRECWTVAYECGYRKLHVLDDHFLIDNQSEHLLVTSAISQYMPVIKYNTGDIGKIHLLDRCKCGKTNTYILNLSNARQIQRLQKNSIGNIIYKKIIKNVISHFHNDDSLILAFSVQESDGNYMQINIEKGSGYTLDVEKEILKNVRTYFGEGINVHINYNYRPVISNTGKQTELLML